MHVLTAPPFFRSEGFPAYLKLRVWKLRPPETIKDYVLELPPGEFSSPPPYPERSRIATLKEARVDIVQIDLTYRDE